jgi:hypothetical protein
MRIDRGVALLTGLTVIAMLYAQHPAGANEPDWKALESAYANEVRPLVVRHCHECHSGESPEADVDLTAFATFADVRKVPKSWQKVREMLDTGQMPPKDAPQPSDNERTQLRDWVHRYLTAEARARAGDPGRVVLRRLNNAEYTYTIRDLTGVDSLEPAREFPVDGAAGEGFTNTGNALVMSPALLTKYLDAAKEIANHAVLLPDGIRFSAHTTRRDWTDETLARIRDLYREYTEATGGTQVNLQGIVWETNQGGRLPLEKYLFATLAERGRLADGRETIDQVAGRYGLNAKYLGTLWSNLNASEPSLLLDVVREHWRASEPEGAAALAVEIVTWQKELWRFGTVGHIGKVGGPKAWLEPVNPLAAKQGIRFKLPAPPDATEVTLSLVASDAGDGNDQDYAVWRQPRLVAPGRPDLPLRDIRVVCRELAARRDRIFAHTAEYLAAAAEASTLQGKLDAAELARRRELDADALAAWLDYLGIGNPGAVELKGHFTTKIANAAGYDFIKGWGSNDTPLIVANSSDQHVRIPGNMKPHSVAVHPSPTLRAAVAWRSPVDDSLRIEAAVTHAHPECGNGVTWLLELRRGATRRRLAAGTAQGGTPATVGPIDLRVLPDDVVSLSIGPRDANHACDLTAVDLRLACAGDARLTWDLADDVSGDIHAGNPHGDLFGHDGVWHFYTEPDQSSGEMPVVPAGSLLAKWQSAQDAAEKRRLAAALHTLLTSVPNAAQAGATSEETNPDAALYRQLTALGGPLLSKLFSQIVADRRNAAPAPAANIVQDPDAVTIEWGPDPAIFGHRLDGKPIDATSLCIHAPAAVTFRLPADLAAGCELVTTGELDSEIGLEGSVQLKAVMGHASAEPGLLPINATVTVGGGQWTSDNRISSFATPVIVNDGSIARNRIESAFADFRQLFPAALCYTKIVPVDEVVTLTLFYREDDHLVRLMLNEGQKARLDRLWDELHYVSRDALTLVDAFAQLMEYATQDADPKVFEPLRQPINDRADAFRQSLIDSEPKHLEALLDFAAGAFRRPLTQVEQRELLVLYRRLREQEIDHEEAFRLTLARVLTAPAFLYRIEKPVAGAGQGPVSAWELASRLSYFLWSSQPDAQLREAAASGRLAATEGLIGEMRRMLGDGRTRRLATEFACQWLHIREFEHLDEKSERHFPTFADLRGAMFEESVRFFTEWLQTDGSVLDLLDADYTFLNEELASHYGIPGVSGPAWRRVDGVKQYSRGGILAQATTLATQSGASRTSPILRGNWISEVLLGERLPRPPKDVPRLPDDETAPEGLTVRQLVERHASDAKCAVCHQRIDAFGFALEVFDAIGRRRERDLGDRPIDTRVKTMDGAQFDGLAGLRDYLLTVRREAFVRQFCRKLLGYALGRAVQLSDEPLLAEIEERLKSNDYHIFTAFEMIVSSPQFRQIRGRETAEEE